MRPTTACTPLAALALLGFVVAQQPLGIPECEPVQKTASGLQWCVLQKGRDEPPPGPDDTVQLHYTGWLQTGKRFGSSRDSGKPVVIALRDMQKGWHEGLQRMAPGTRCKFVIPPDLAYGEQGAPGAGVPPNATVVYEIELLRVFRMPKLDPQRVKALASGVKYEVAVTGDGPAASADDLVSLRFAIWTAKGALWDHTEHSNKQLRGVRSEIEPGFVRELVMDVAELKVGTVVRAMVPSSVYPNPGSDSVWELEVTSRKPKPQVPKFRLPDQGKVVTTQSGLSYEVITMGQGARPTRGDTVILHYTGWLEDGTVFDSSHARGEPDEVALNRVIRGWVEGVQLMAPGSTFLFHVPSQLGYGARGREPEIPPHQNLVFLIELIDVKKK